MSVKSSMANVGDLTDIHTSQKNPLGQIVQTDDGGEYIYLKGVASLVAGDWVTYDEAGVTTRAVADAVGPMAIAMAAVVANDFGWFCIKSPEGGVSGNAGTSFADNAIPYLTATAGRVDDAAVAGDLVFNAIARSAEASNLATFQIDHPFVSNGAYLT